MPVVNRLADWHEELSAWRRDLHRNPELGFEVERTAAFVADRLKEMGCDEIVTGIGGTGVVGMIAGKRAQGPVIGMRADMDALPIAEESGKPWTSEVPGRMHACGHDGHTTMLLAAARYLAENRNFAGKAVVIFQPAEEGGAGGQAMVDDGLMERFGIDEVYGMHNLPGIPVGNFAIKPGAIFASASHFEIEIEGRGGHAAFPHHTIDPIIIGTQIVSALQTIVSRNVDPVKAGVVSLTTFHGGNVFNIIPQRAVLTGTVRALETGVLDLIHRRMREMTPALAEALGGTAKMAFSGVPYPVTLNHRDQTVKAAGIARGIAGDDNVDENMAPLMTGEDFSFMLQARPGALILVGNGDTAGLHHPAYDFNDSAIPHGASYWIRLAETLMPAQNA